MRTDDRYTECWERTDGERVEVFSSGLKSHLSQWENLWMRWDLFTSSRGNQRISGILISQLPFSLYSSGVIRLSALASLKQVMPDWEQVESSHPICRIFHFLCRAGCWSRVLPVSRTERTSTSCSRRALTVKRRQNGEQKGKREKIRQRKRETEKEWGEKETAREIESNSERKWEKSKWFPDWVHSRGELVSEGVWNVTTGSWNLDRGICYWDFFICLLCVCASVNHFVGDKIRSLSQVIGKGAGKLFRS